MQHYGCHYLLVLAVITRWGTQYRLINSLRRCKDALRAYANDSQRVKSDLRDNAGQTLKNPSFWAGLDQLNDILKPIDELLRIPESGKAHLGTVLARWKTIDALIPQHAFHVTGLTKFRLDKFIPRFHRQVNDMHWAAYFLMPQHVDQAMRPEDQQCVFRFFKAHTDNINSAQL
jgi:hypothetical protein